MSASKRVLVVEDDQTLRYLAKRQLNKLGYDCHIADGGRASVEMVKEKPFDLIFMDVQMPDIDGLEATRLIRLYETEAKVEHPCTIVAMTANPSKDVCLDAGMNDFVFKPVMLEELKRVLAKWLQSE